MPKAYPVSFTMFKALLSEREVHKVEKIVILSIWTRQFPWNCAFVSRQLAFQPSQSAIHGRQFTIKTTN